MTGRLRIPVPFGPPHIDRITPPGGVRGNPLLDSGGTERTDLAEGRIKKLERGWQKWETLVWDANTTSPAIGNGTLQGWYRFDERWMEAWIELAAGSTTTFGTGSMRFEGRPLPSSPPYSPAIVGWCMAYDDSAGNVHAGSVQLSTTGTLVPRMPNYAGANGIVTAVNNTAPFTFATSDQISVYAKLRYRD